MWCRQVFTCLCIYMCEFVLCVCTYAVCGHVGYTPTHICMSAKCVCVCVCARAHAYE